MRIIQIFEHVPYLLGIIHIRNVWKQFFFNTHDKYGHCLVSVISQVEWCWGSPLEHLQLLLPVVASSCLRCPHQVPKFLLFQCKVNLHLPNFIIVWAFKLVHLYETHNMLCLLRFHNRSHYVRLLFTLSFTTNHKVPFTFFHTRSQLPILDGVIVSLKKNKWLSWKNALFSLTKLWYHVEKLDYT